MGVEDLYSSWKTIPGPKDKYPQDEIFDKNDKKEIMELISAERFRLKMSPRWKAEDKAISKHEKELIEQYGSTFKEISEQRLAELESQLDEFSKSANEIRFRSLLKNVYNLDAASLKYLFHEENEEHHKRLNQSDVILKKEWKKFLNFQRFKSSLKKKKKSDDDCEAPNATEKESKQKIRFDEKNDIGPSTTPFFSKGLSAEDYEGKKQVETMAERSTRFKENQKGTLITSQKGSTDQREKRRRKNKKKGAEKEYGGYVDEECNICQRYEKTWEIDRLKKTNYLEAMTPEDAKEFHTRLVRSGGMRGLVEQFKILLDEEPPTNLALTKFIRQMAHPEAGQEFNELLVDYNCLRFLQEGLNEIDKVVKKERKKMIFDSNTDFQPKCTFCRMIWYLTKPIYGYFISMGIGYFKQLKDDMDQLGLTEQDCFDSDEYGRTLKGIKVLLEKKRPKKGLEGHVGKEETDEEEALDL